METWKEVPNCNGIIMVSDLGRIKSVDRWVNHSRKGKVFKVGKILKQATKENGYKAISVYVNPRYQTHYIHRLVAQAFIKNELNKGDVNHKNCDKADNRSENLEWVTRKENFKHAMDNNLLPIGENRHNAIMTNETVIRIKSMLSNGVKQIDIASYFGVDKRIVNNIKMGRTWAKVL